MHTTIDTTKRYFLGFIAAAIATSLSSCNSNPTPNQENISQTPAPTTTAAISSPSPSQTPSMAQFRAKSEDVQTPTPTESPTDTPTPAESPTTSNQTTDVTLYTSDTQCQQLIPQKVPVSADEPVKAAVGKILEKRDSGDFSLSSYRINVKNGVATVDLRVAPNSKRQIASLSSCEQFALFGSVRKTLTSNAQWKIKDVRFTERGEEIVF
ncbi:GerMN domain-containing protein [Calothrix sp. FACHB-1219]|uniref:GerMN domain-containing protein n=1 Tax=unclassified Calothrix TaxID=2619626 RepID=UPI0016857934|nr:MULTISPECIES: GerMN domain-containing protein [unclassified Calothrix]MBD2203800.1 GerMN domain-containing protein [Calothrix sp. FACHB-168]MBD2219618.1 GerMN domain-containing protein [Calothrix sp. FACHB-1219]